MDNVSIDNTNTADKDEEALDRLTGDGILTIDEQDELLEAMTGWDDVDFMNEYINRDN